MREALPRWAFNCPEQLRRLEADGEILLPGRLLEQHGTTRSIRENLLRDYEALPQNREKAILGRLRNLISH